MAELRDIAWRFISAASTVTSQAALDDLAADTLKPFGVDRFDCGRLAPSGGDEPRGVLSGRGLADWVRYFQDQRYNEIDPCETLFTQHARAYTWSDIKARTIDERSMRMWNDAYANGLREALIVPTVPRRPTAPTVRLITSENASNPDHLPNLQTIALLYASNTQNFSGTARTMQATEVWRGPLSEREIECLQWSLSGKSNGEMAIILGISKHTVNSHIENAKRKLSVATRMQAAAKALQMGLMSIA